VPRRLRNLLVLLGALLTLALPATAAARGGEVRVGGNCGTGASSALSLKAHHGAIEVRFRVRQGRGSSVWRVSIVHEDRVASRSRVRTHGSSHSFEVRRSVADFSGADRVTARATSPRGINCVASAVLPG
jgi:hypothetical protein